MDLRVFNYFLQVAKEENMSKAAQMLHLTQPTLSRQIRQLEEDLDTELFIRDSRGLTLTEDGRAFYRKAEDIVNLVEKTYQEFRSDEQNLEGTISIGCVETHNMTHLSRYIAGFQKLYPRVRFEIYTALTDEIEERMEKGLLDVGMLMEPIDVSRYHFRTLNYLETWGILTEEGSELAELKSVKPADLLGIPLIFPSRALTMKDGIKQWLGNDFDRMTISATYTLVNNAVCLVEQGVGTMVCIWMPGVLEREGIRFIPLDGMGTMNAALVWRRGVILSKTCQKFLFYCGNAQIA